MLAGILHLLRLAMRFIIPSLALFMIFFAINCGVIAPPGGILASPGGNDIDDTEDTVGVNQEEIYTPLYISLGENVQVRQTESYSGAFSIGSSVSISQVSSPSFDMTNSAALTLPITP